METEWRFTRRYAKINDEKILKDIIIISQIIVATVPVATITVLAIIGSYHQINRMLRILSLSQWKQQLQQSMTAVDVEREQKEETMRRKRWLIIMFSIVCVWAILSLLMLQSNLTIINTNIRADKRTQVLERVIQQPKQEVKLPSMDHPYNDPCDWPLPLYPPYPNNPVHPGLRDAVRKAKSFFDSYPNITFSYIDSGGALGVYRNGGLIPGDSDLDIRFGICDIRQQQDENKIVSFPNVNNAFISPNKYSRYGDIWTRRQLPTIESRSLIQEIQGDLCLHEYAPGETYWFHKNAMQKRAFVYTYGDFWFVKLPWKGVHNMHTWYDYAKANKGGRQKDGFQSNWDRSLAAINDMDVNNDMEISVEELNKRVIEDGIIVERYMSQITDRERCRAAAMMTTILQFNENPYRIPLPANQSYTTGDHPRFKYLECEKR